MNSPHALASARTAQAMTSPDALRVLGALGAGARTAPALARELQLEEHAVRGCLRDLERARFVRRAGERGMYELAAEPRVPEEVWDRLPLPVRRSAVGTALVQIHSLAAAAADNGGFDHGTMHLSRSTLDLDEAGRREVLRILDDALDQVAALGQRAPTGPTEPTAVVLLGFRTPQADHPTGPSPDVVDADRDEELAEVWDLAAAAHAATHEKVVDLGRVAELADRLSLAARAAQARSGAPTVERQV